MARLGSRTSSYPGRRHYRSVRSRMPVLSATIFDAVFVRAGFGTCRLGLITVWLPVRVLPAPPRTPTLTKISRGLTNSPRFRGGVGPAYILCSEEGGLQRQFRAFSGVQKPFPRSLRRSDQRLGSHATPLLPIRRRRPTRLGDAPGKAAGDNLAKLDGNERSTAGLSVMRG